ncbi:jg8223 [Pararge aegeria aegeria]|uniref:Jg8223 protein n=1 Tax=Pararge aegeria aegeria TaxID=348720 RepID=A0A8S4SIL3_9NEOP|nr:jg8223 [Pararge aegeria aegeria]
MAGERQPSAQLNEHFQESRPLKKDPTHPGRVRVGKLEFLVQHPGSLGSLGASHRLRFVYRGVCLGKLEKQ